MAHASTTEDRLGNAEVGASRRPVTIAFYLPQFHPIPENDAWYGAGFTEWVNVAQARPLFPGHYQPHIPKDLGFYDLRVPETRLQQVRLARQYGIDAFCYYHYWFEGQRPLHRVIDEQLDFGPSDMPFCLAWANENWSRHWDASDREILLRQRYSPDDDVEHGRFLLRALTHPRYLRVAGRPVLFIYRPQSLPDPRGTMNRWREMWRAGGVDDVHIVKFDTRGDADDPRLYGADAAAQFIPHGLMKAIPRLTVEGSKPGNWIMDYADVVHHALDMEQPGWRRYECVAPGWDNSPRRGDGESLLLHGSTPELYETWLRGVAERAGADGIVLINAWNEWAEGAHLEPDQRHGRAYLEATARAVGKSDVPTAAEPDLLHPEPFETGDTFAELYLDGLEAQTRLQRRLSRLEATMDRQVEAARRAERKEADELRAAALVLAREVDRLGAGRRRHVLARLRRSPNPS